MKEIITKETTTSKNVPVGEEKVGKSQTIGYIIYFLFGVVEILLIFRLVFKLTGASPTSNFVSAIYSLTEICTIPFTGIFPQATTPGVTTTAILEPATLIAIVVYAILAWGIAQIVVILSRRMQ